MKVLVIGANGQLGKDVVKELIKNEIDAISCDIVGQYDYYLDFVNKEDTIRLVNSIKPNAIINCAAWTAVDAAEEEINKDKVYSINVLGVENLVEAAKQCDCKLLHISTDYVFSGQGEKPWKADDKCYSPLNYYGETKLLSELAISNNLDKYFIVRTAWLFGGPISFVNTMLKIGKNHEKVRVVNDQIGTPTYSKDLAVLLSRMIQTDKYGYYHATNEGEYISWYDFCKEIYRIAGYKTRIIPVSTDEYGLSKAKRPLNSRLDKTKLKESGFELLPNWKNALSRYIKSLNINSI